MNFTELEYRGAWCLLMDARAHILYSGDLLADSELARAVREVWREIRPLPVTDCWIQSKFWKEKRPQGSKDYVAVDVRLLDKGRVIGSGTIEYTENG